MGLGKLTHYSFDFILISIILAGINRNTGLVFDTASFSSVDVRKWFGRYLELGERCYDYTVAILKKSGYFRQKNFLLDSVKKETDKIFNERRDEVVKKMQ